MFIKPLLLLALSVKALSLPTTDKALEKRDDGAWIGSFEDADTTCSNSSNFINSWPTYPLSDGVCVQFSPKDYTVGGSWGDIATIETFSDVSCSVHQGFFPNNGTGLAFCILVECGNGDVGNPCFWNSVMGHSNAPIVNPKLGSDSRSGSTAE